MEKGRCLGLVGGLGVGATIHYYKKLAEAHAARGRTLDVVMAHAEVPRVFAFVEAEDRSGLANYLAGFIGRLQAAGAEVAAIPAVTPHFCINELVALSPLPIVSIFDPLIEALAASAMRRVSIFGARFVIESDLFGFAKNVEIVRPMPEEVEVIHHTYADLAQKGYGSEEQYETLTDIAQTLQTRDGVDAIIFAGTDLSLLFNETNTAFPSLDCAALHLDAILTRLLDGTSSNG